MLKSFTRDDDRRRHEREIHSEVRCSASRRRTASGRFGSVKDPVNISDQGTNLEYNSMRRESLLLLEPSLPQNTSDHDHQSMDLSDLGSLGDTWPIMDHQYSLDGFDMGDQDLIGMARSFSTRSSSLLNDSGSSINRALHFPSTNTSISTPSFDREQISSDEDVHHPNLNVDDTPKPHDNVSLASRLTKAIPLRALSTRGKSRARLAATYSRRSRPCTICQKPFGSTVEDVRVHLDEHLKEFNAQHECEVCMVYFKRQSDLRYHLACAQRGHCGLEFKHANCTGHHPPTDDAGVSDNDRMRIWSSLREWENAQLQAFTSVVEEVLEHTPREAECRSVDGVLCKSVRTVSALLGGLAIRSTPSHVQYHLRNAVDEFRRSFVDRMSHHHLGSVKITIGSKLDARIKSCEQDDRALVHAAGVANLSKMKLLILRGADVNHICKLRDGRHECTPLMAAVCSDLIEPVELLLDQGASVDGICDPISPTLVTPLSIAAASGNLKIARMLMAAGAEVDAQYSGQAGTAACYAARNGQTDVLTMLIDKGANLHSKATLMEHSDDDSDGIIPPGNVLSLAVYNNHTDTVQVLLDRWKESFTPCEAGLALDMAVYQGNRAVTEHLLQVYPNVHTYFAVWIAGSLGYKGLVDLHLDHQACSHTSLPPWPEVMLQDAINTGVKGIVGLLSSSRRLSSCECDDAPFGDHELEANFLDNLMSGVETPQASAFGNDKHSLADALHCAVFHNDGRLVRILLANGAGSRSYPVSHRWLANTAFLAARMGHTDVMDLFFDHGVGTNLANHFCPNIIEAAVESGNATMVRLLLDYGVVFAQRADRADQWDCCPFNETVQRAVGAGKVATIRLLIEHGLDVNQSHIPFSGQTGYSKHTRLLHIASSAIPKPGCIEMVKLLLEAGADVEARVSFRTALDVVHHKLSRMESSDPNYRDVEILVTIMLRHEQQIEMERYRSRCQLLASVARRRGAAA